MNETPNFDSGRPVFTLGVVSRLSNIPAHSIRQYIDRGLLIPFKLDSNRHLFSQDDVRRLRSIHQLIHEKGLNFSGIRAMMAMIPCWAIHQCSLKDRQNCSAYADGFNPCWEASEKGRDCRNENCRECQVYQIIASEMNLKSVVQKLV